jgi:hypothetical protein
MFLLGILIGALLITPLTFSPYQVLDSEVAFSDDMVAYNDMYLLNFGELGNAGEEDGMLVCWFNITAAVHVLIGISFSEQTTVYRIGVLLHDDEIIRLRDTSNPNRSMAYQLDITTIGLYSCSVFFVAGNHSLVGIRVLYFS